MWERPCCQGRRAGCRQAASRHVSAQGMQGHTPIKYYEQVSGNDSVPAVQLCSIFKQIPPRVYRVCRYRLTNQKRAPRVRQKLQLHFVIQEQEPKQYHAKVSPKRSRGF